MSSFDDIALPDANLNADDTSTNQGKFVNLWKLGRDVWWRVCSRTGLAKLIAAFSDGILTRPVNVLDANWNPTKATTWTGREIGALPQNFANVKASADAAKASADAAAAAVDALKASIPVAVNAAAAAALEGRDIPAPTIDTAKLAAAVADELAARLKGA